MNPAEALFAACVIYLEMRGWYRDGDDPGVWYGHAGVGYGDAWTLGEALQVQLEADGVSLLEVPA